MGWPTAASQVGENLMISDRAHVIFPWHFEEDRLLDKQVRRRGEAIGTTMRGIGPCYQDKVGRRLADARSAICIARSSASGSTRSRGPSTQLFAALAAARRSGLTPQEIFHQYHDYAGRLEPHVRRHDRLPARRGRKPASGCCSRAQGALLDIDHGTFPFVTSSNSSGVGVSAGSGVPADTSPRSSAWSRRIARASAAARSPPSKTTRSASKSAAAATNTAP